MAKRVAILGAGASGLPGIKCCLDENLQPFCFERTDGLGGLWNFMEKVQEDQGCVMRSTIMNSSKEMMCFSDFPVPKEFPIFMHNTQTIEYFKKYAKEFNLIKHIQYNKEVMSVKQSKDYEQTGRWDLQVRDHKTGSEETLVFDAVLICTGHHATKNIPTFAGQEEFQGKILHSKDYRDWTGYVGKRALVVGLGNSAVDIAAELSRVGQVFLSTRRGCWLFPKLTEQGLPFDLMYTRYSNFKRHHRSINAPAYLREYDRKVDLDHKLYALQPKSTAFAQTLLLNDELPFRIASGSIKVKADVKRITRTGVEFGDGTFEDNIDVIILATGYVFGFPFLDKSVIDVQNNKVELYKYMFPPDLPKQTLAVIGCFQPVGAAMPIGEMQCRLASRVFKGLCTLPSKYEMWRDIRKKQASVAARYVASQRHTIQVNFIDYMDELAQLVGCRPKIGELFLTDFTLAVKCFFGPCTPYQYRLRGPGQWSGARDAIMTQTDRMKYPLQTRPLPEDCADENKEYHLVMFVILIVVLAVVYKLF